MLDLTVVASVSRPAHLATVIANFKRQNQPARLLVVLNGPARGVRVEGDWDVIECEGGTPARPRNFGLKWVQERRDGVVAFWDDDDYYGPDYLSEVAGNLVGERLRVVGKVVRFAEFDDGVWLFMRKQGQAFLGGTMAGWARELPLIPDLPCHEDHEWCRLLRDGGFELVTLSGAHYLYNRTSGPHAWRSSRVKMLHCYGPALALGQVEPCIVDRPLTGGAYTPKATLEDIQEDVMQGLLGRSIDDVTH